MQRIKLLGLMLLTIFAISAISAATASAEMPEILPVPTAAAPLNYTFTSPAGMLETTAGRIIKCEKDKGSGSFTSQDSGTFTVDFEECTEPKSGANCNTAGDPAKTILLATTETTGSLVDLSSTGLPLGFLVTLSGDVKITCGVLKILVLSSVLGKVDGVTNNVKTKTAKLLFHKTKGEQELTTCILLKATCEGKTFKLGADFGNGEELAGLESEETVTFAKEAEVHF